MRYKKKGWIRTNNIYSYLTLRALLALLVLFATQVFFYFVNQRIFVVADGKEWGGILWGNVIFGMATIGFMLLPYFALNLLPFKFRWNSRFHLTVEAVLYYVPVIFLVVANVADGAYYQFTYRRLSGEIFRYLGIGGDMGSLVPRFLLDYWYATLFGVVILTLFIVAARNIRLTQRSIFRKHRTKDIIGFVLGGLCVFFLFRGGFGRNVEWHDGTRYCQAKNSALVANSGYNIVRTLDGGTLEERNYMDDREARKLFNPIFVSDGKADTLSGWSRGGGILPSADETSGIPRYSNVVVIVLESFSQEYMGCYNHGIMPSRTPFLDSLARHSMLYQGRANGKKSIEGIPAIFASMPTLMTFPLTLSDYADDSLYALPAILRDHGFRTAFFHGSYNGVMAFDKLCRQLGFQDYYGKDEYMSDCFARSEDYDGCWGIYDEYFLQYMNRKLERMPEPFFAGVFTLSSHHPYKMQPGHEGDFSEGEHPLLPVVAYSDNALRKFFDSARKTSWYRNTLFVITADHPGQGLHREYNDYDGWYRIPMMFYLPRCEDTRLGAAPSDRTHFVSPRLMQQLDIMPTLIDYLGIDTRTVCFGTSAFRNPDHGWQIAYGNGYYQLETRQGVSLIASDSECDNGSLNLLKAVVQQYNHRLISNRLTAE